jgi:hypothetical protein
MNPSFVILVQEVAVELGLLLRKRWGSNEMLSNRNDKLLRSFSDRHEICLSVNQDKQCVTSNDIHGQTLTSVVLVRCTNID